VNLECAALQFDLMEVAELFFLKLVSFTLLSLVGCMRLDVCYYSYRNVDGAVVPMCRVQARILQPLRLDPDRPEYHRATVWWAINDGSGNPGYCFSHCLV
jgi:gephyrin